MRKFFTIMTAALATIALATSCSGGSDIKGFKKTENGLHYKFIKENTEEQKVQIGDILVCEIVMRIDSTETYSNMGNPDRTFQVLESQFKGDLSEGLQMLHKGDHAIFAIEMDSLSQYFSPNQMPKGYIPNQGMKMYYEIILHDIVTKEEQAQEQANYMAEMEERKNKEPEMIAQYISDNNITTKPNANGVYVIVDKKGNGTKVAPGKKVKMNYTGRLLDGTVFDTSVETVAQESGVFNPNRPYEPLSYTVGQMSLIKGWEDGVMGQPSGSKLTLIIPSSMGYGPQGAGNTIPPYSPLIFNIEIVEVI